ncbi:MAG: cation diffusion facilitator family transporter [Tepidiformaceae bacterium]
MAEESRKTVLAAMGANFGIAVGKLAAGLITGSGAMLAEAGHSAADTVNQVFLLLGLRLAEAKPDEDHPHGYGKEGFFWSFLAAIFIFVAGATFSVYEGLRTLAQNDVHERTATELAIGFGVLGMAFLFESVSFVVAVRELRRSASRRAWSFVQYLRKSPDLTTKTVFWEDSAALAGLALAALGLFVSEVTGNEHWDGAAALSIGAVLALVAVMLGLQSRKLLLGAAASEETRMAISASVRAFPEVQQVVRLLTMQLGSHSVLVSGELAVQRRMTTEQIEDLLLRIDTQLEKDVPEVSETFWELKRGTDEAKPAGDR